MNVKEKWLAFSDIAHRVELNLVLSSLGAMGNCEFVKSASDLRQLVSEARPDEYSVAIGSFQGDVSDINLAAAISHDRNARAVVLVRRNASGSLRSRAARAGIDLVLDPIEIIELAKAGRIQIVDGGLNVLPALPDSDLDKFPSSISSPKADTTLENLVPPPEISHAPILTITSGRGGVGKTTIAAAFALIAASWGMKVGLIDLDLSCGNLYSCFAHTKLNDLARFAVNEPRDIESLKASAVVAAENILLWGPCLKPEMAEMVTPFAGNLIQAISGIVDVVIVDTSTTPTDIVAQAAQLSDRFVIVTGRPVFSLASMSRTSSLAVRLGVARTRIVRIENKADPRLRQDISTGRAEIGLEAARQYQVFDGGPDVLSLISSGQLPMLLQESSPFSNSLAATLAQLFLGLGALPKCDAANKASKWSLEHRLLGLFRKQKEVG